MSSTVTFYFSVEDAKTAIELLDSHFPIGDGWREKTDGFMEVGYHEIKNGGDEGVDLLKNAHISHIRYYGTDVEYSPGASAFDAETGEEIEISTDYDSNPVVRFYNAETFEDDDIEDAKKFYELKNRIEERWEQ